MSELLAFLIAFLLCCLIVYCGRKAEEGSEQEVYYGAYLRKTRSLIKYRISKDTENNKISVINEDDMRYLFGSEGGLMFYLNCNALTYTKHEGYYEIQKRNYL